MNYLYLHGFASGPTSKKSRFFQERLRSLGVEPEMPDLNLGNFTEITVTTILGEMDRRIRSRSGPWRLIGASFGGYLAALYAASNPAVEGLFLMAPAMEFWIRQSQRLGASAVESWEREGFFNFDHYAGGDGKLPLSYRFVEDLKGYPALPENGSLPVFICHGLEDEVVDYEASLDYASKHPGTSLLLIHSDHSLNEHLERIWEEMVRFWKLPTISG